jgi:phage/plasmid-associated DNA primase
MSVKTPRQAKDQEATVLSRRTLDRLEAEYHGPALSNAKGQPAHINERFWAATFAHCHQTIYEPDEDRLYVYEPERGLFRNQHTAVLRETIIRLIYDVAKKRPEAAYLAVTRFVSMHLIGGVIEALKGLTCQPNAFRRQLSDPSFLHTANCMLVYNECEFHREPFSPKFRSRNQSPIPYDKNASQDSFRRAFFDHRCPPENIVLFQKYGGQCLLGRNLSQSILLLDGVAESSKTTLALVIADTIGRENCTELRTGQLGERFENGAFIGKSLLIAPDVKANFLSLYGASFLKSLVGNDILCAELKRSDRRVDLEGFFNVIITSNSRLRVRLEGDADAWKRRLLIVRFEHPLQNERITDFHRVIVQNEGPGILNFLIEGCTLLLNDLDHGGRLSLSLNQSNHINRFIAESDSLRQFLLGNLSAVSQSESDLTTNEILEAYYADCVASEINSIPTAEAQKILPELMKDLFAKSRSHDIKRLNKSHRGYRGVRLRPKDDPDP